MVFIYMKFGKICLCLLHLKCLILHEEKHLMPWEKHPGRRSCLHLEHAERKDLFLGVITAQLSCSCFILRHLSPGCRLETEDWIKCRRFLVWFIMTAPIFCSHSLLELTRALRTQRSSGRLPHSYLSLGKVGLAEWSSNLSQCYSRWY